MRRTGVSWRTASTMSPGSSVMPTWPSSVRMTSWSGSFAVGVTRTGADAGMTMGRVQDRAAGRQVVGGGAGGARDDQSVRVEAGDEIAADRHGELDDSRQRPPGNHQVCLLYTS